MRGSARPAPRARRGERRAGASAQVAPKPRPRRASARTAAARGGLPRRTARLARSRSPSVAEYPSLKIRYSTRSTPRRRSGSSSSSGTRYGIRASAILRLARTIRLPIVGSATRNARAISPVVSPPSARSVNATRADRSSAGWQQVKISRRRSSTIALSSSTSGCSWRSSRISSASRSARSATDRLRRIRSIARRRDATVSHAPGRARDAVAPPRADGVGERVLHCVLGQLKVAHMSDQGRQHRRALRRGTLPRSRRRPDPGSRGVAAPESSRRAGAPIGPRDLVVGHDRPHLDRPVPGPGQHARHARPPRRDPRNRARSSRTSTSLVTANGPSVNSVSSPRTRTVVAVATECSGPFLTSTPASSQARVHLVPQRHLRPSLSPLSLVALGPVKQQHVLRHARLLSVRPHDTRPLPLRRRTQDDLDSATRVQAVPFSSTAPCASCRQSRPAPAPGSWSRKSPKRALTPPSPMTPGRVPVSRRVSRLASPDPADADCCSGSPAGRSSTERLGPPAATLRQSGRCHFAPGSAQKRCAGVSRAAEPHCLPPGPREQSRA